MTITYTEAMDICTEWIAAMARSSSITLVVEWGNAVELDIGWIFFYNSEEYFRTRDPLQAIVGNGPILVMRSGEARTLPTHEPWKEAVEKIRLEEQRQKPL